MDNSVSYKEKVSLTEKVKMLRPIDLTSFVYKLQELCPKAVADTDSKKLQIKINDIDKESFDKIMDLLDTMIEEDDSNEPPSKKFKENEENPT